jgi:hypothetical protein
LGSGKLNIREGVETEAGDTNLICGFVLIESMRWEEEEEEEEEEKEKEGRVISCWYSYVNRFKKIEKKKKRRTVVSRNPHAVPHWTTSPLVFVSYASTLVSIRPLGCHSQPVVSPRHRHFPDTNINAHSWHHTHGPTCDGGPHPKRTQ